MSEGEMTRRAGERGGMMRQTVVPYEPYSAAELDAAFAEVGFAFALVVGIQEIGREHLRRGESQMSNRGPQGELTRFRPPNRSASRGEATDLTREPERSSSGSKLVRVGLGEGEGEGRRKGVVLQGQRSRGRGVSSRS